MGGRGASSGVSRDKYGNPKHRLLNYKKAIIEKPKLKNYLLNPNKSKGKEAFFNSLGYNMKNSDRMIVDIKSELSNNKARKTRQNEYGAFYAVDVNIGIDRKAKVTTIWNVNKSTKSPKFVTAYPKR